MQYAIFIKLNTIQEMFLHFTDPSTMNKVNKYEIKNKITNIGQYNIAKIGIMNGNNIG